MAEGSSFGRNKAIITTVVGAGALIGAAGLLLYNFVEKEKRKQKLRSTCQQSTSSLSTTRRNSVCSFRTQDEFFSALDTEDEYYDLYSEDEETTLDEDDSEKKLFEEVDVLMKGDDDDRRKAFNLLKKHDFKMSENPDFLWRFAKAHQIQAVLCEAVKDMENKKKYIFEGLEYASKALAMDDTNPDVHKWFAILKGMQGDFLSLKQKIQNGYLFQKHVLKAIEGKPDDYSLHHLLGRFKFEVAGVSWMGKKMAASILAEVPDFNYSDAIPDFLTAEKLNPTPWKENRLLLAKCYIGDKKYDKAMMWLTSAKNITPITKQDEACDEEISTLIQKWKKYEAAA